MSYSPKHRAPKQHSARQRLAGAAVAGAASLGAAVLVAPSASATPSVSSAPAAATAGNVWDRVAKCESGGNWKINTGNGYYGGLQFSYRTWLGFGGGKYAKTANRATKAQQIEIAKKVLKVQGPGAWPTCSKRAGLTRANGLAAGATGAPKKTVKPAPSRSTTRSGKLTIDGRFGPTTKRHLERWIGGSVNGSMSKADVRKFEAKVGGSRNGTFRSDDIRRLQRMTGAGVDGVWGPQTTRQLQRYLNSR